MTIALVIAALALVGYVSSGVRIYRRERAADVALECVTPYFAMIRVGHCHHVQVTLFTQPLHVTFPSELFPWEVRLAERLETRRARRAA
jgi:hypothetical protein